MFAFGNFIVCSSTDIAKKIAYNSNKSLTCKCVTYDGDVYEPGTLTGGSDPKIPFILPKYNILRRIEEKINM
jgi:structural maintenance of chromosome 2